MSADSHSADLRGAASSPIRQAVEALRFSEARAETVLAERPDSGRAGPIAGRIMALEVFATILTVLVVSIGSFQFHFTLPVVGFVLFLIIVVAALRLGFWQATVSSVVAVGCLDFFFTQPLFSLKTDAAGVTALAAFESAAIVVSRLSAQVQ